MEDEEFGEFLSVLADRDGDGYSELLVGTRDGRVYAFSPATGEHWYTLREYEPLGSSEGGSIVPVLDHDGDGYEDFIRANAAAIVPRPGERSVDGSLGLHSGRDGRYLWEFYPQPEEGDGIYRSVCLAGDHDGDGYEDVLVGRETPGTLGVRGLFLVSGEDGSLLRIIESPLEETGDRTSWGFFLSNLGDQDGDGQPEVAVSANFYGDAVRPLSGWVGVYAMPDFHLRWSRSGVDAREALGVPLANAGDHDGDGADDLFVSTTRKAFHARHDRLYILSGRNGQAIHVIEGLLSLFGDRLGGTFPENLIHEVSPLDDVDGDGTMDFIATRPTVPDGFDGEFGSFRVVRVRADRPRFLRGDANGDGAVDLSDGLKIIEELMHGETPACEWAEDLNQNGAVDVSDAVRLFQCLFTDERETIPPPYPDCARYDMLHRYRPLPCADSGICAR